MDAAETSVGYGEKSANVTLRGYFELYGNIRPARELPGIRTPFPGRGIDGVIVRENVEDLYAGIEYMQTPGVAETLKLISKLGCERVLQLAYGLARAEGRNWLMRGASSPSFGRQPLGWSAASAWRPAAMSATTPRCSRRCTARRRPSRARASPTRPRCCSRPSCCCATSGTSRPPSASSRRCSSPSRRAAASPATSRPAAPARAPLPTPTRWSPTSAAPAPPRPAATALNLPRWPEATWHREPDSRELVGLDMLIESGLGAQALGDELAALTTDGPFRLTMMSNRGAKVWPPTGGRAYPVDHFRCRFLLRQPGGDDAAEIADLLARIGSRHRWMHLETLQRFDGADGFSKAQGEA